MLYLAILDVPIGVELGAQAAFFSTPPALLYINADSCVFDRPKRKKEKKVGTYKKRGTLRQWNKMVQPSPRSFNLVI